MILAEGFGRDSATVDGRQQQLCGSPSPCLHSIYHPQCGIVGLARMVKISMTLYHLRQWRKSPPCGAHVAKLIEKAIVALRSTLLRPCGFETVASVIWAAARCADILPIEYDARSSLPVSARLRCCSRVRLFPLAGPQTYACACEASPSVFSLVGHICVDFSRFPPGSRTGAFLLSMAFIFALRWSRQWLGNGLRVVKPALAKTSPSGDTFESTDDAPLLLCSALLLSPQATLQQLQSAL